MASMTGIPILRNSNVVRAAHEVGALLQDYDYSPRARSEVVAYTIAHGTPSGCPSLDLEDEADAEMVFAESFDPVPFDDLAAWGDDGFDDADAAFREAVRHFELPDPAGEDDDTIDWPAPVIPADRLPVRARTDRSDRAARSLLTAAAIGVVGGLGVGMISAEALAWGDAACRAAEAPAPLPPIRGGSPEPDALDWWGQTQAYLDARERGEAWAV